MIHDPSSPKRVKSFHRHLCSVVSGEAGQRTPGDSSPKIIPPTPSPEGSKKKKRMRRRRDAKKTPAIPPMPPKALTSTSSKTRQSQSSKNPTPERLQLPDDCVIAGSHSARPRKKTANGSPREKAPLRTPPSFPTSPTRASPTVCSRRFLDSSPSLRAKKTGQQVQDGAHVAALP